MQIAQETTFVTENVEIEKQRVRVLPDGRLSRWDAALYLGLKPKTLSMWQVAGKGPRPVRVGGRVFYYLADLNAFVRGDDAAETAGAPGPEVAQR